MTLLTLVVPCYNEATRWPSSHWREMTELPDINWIFVNDGSTDATAQKISELTSLPNVSSLELSKNQGKAEAVRQGLLKALQTDSVTQLLGFVDADASISPMEIHRVSSLAHLLLIENKAYDALWGSRVQLAGRLISRKAHRHYIGRILSSIIGLRYTFLPYDTQCGLKIFSTSYNIAPLLSTRFSTRWFLDVELLIRSKNSTESMLKVWEEPLMDWCEIGESSLGFSHAFSVISDVAKVLLNEQKLRREPVGS